MRWDNETATMWREAGNRAEAEFREHIAGDLTVLLDWYRLLVEISNHISIIEHLIRVNSENFPATLTQLPHSDEFPAEKAADFLRFAGSQAACGAKRSPGPEDSPRDYLDDRRFGMVSSIVIVREHG